MRPSLRLAGVALLASALAARGGARAPAAAAVTELKLDNGMSFLLVRRPELPTVSAGWVARVGSVHEAPGITGLTHFLEHMLFKGTKVITKGELGRLYAAAGARGLNALTVQDMTLYFVTLPAEKLELWFWLESDRLLSPELREFDTEKEVVREERRQRTESTPTGLQDEELRAAFWGAHPYGWPTLGRPADLARLTVLDAERYFATHYGPGNLTAALVGNFDPAVVRTLAERYFGRLKARPAPAPVSAAVEIHRGEVRRDFTCACPPQLQLLYPAPAMTHPDSPVFEVLAGLLNGRTGRLYRSLVVDQGIATAAYALSVPMRWAGSFTVTVEAKGEVAPEALLAAWDRELERLQSTPIEPAELLRVKNQITADGYRRLKEPSAFMMQLLMNAGFGDWRLVQGGPERALAVTEGEVQRAVRELLAPERRTVGFYRRSAEAGR